MGYGETMGGYGSTRWGWHTKKRTTEDCLSLDVSRLRYRGFLQPNAPVKAGRITWASGSNLGFTLHTEATEGEMKLCYSCAGKEMIYPVRLATTRPPFGGLRWWFLCPWCHRRTRYLYLAFRNGRFECRLCCGLTYRSSQEHNKTLDRYMRLPPQALAQIMAGSGRGAFRAATAILELESRVVESIGRRTGVLGNAGIIGEQKALGA